MHSARSRDAAAGESGGGGDRGGNGGVLGGGGASGGAVGSGGGNGVGGAFGGGRGGGGGSEGDAGPHGAHSGVEACVATNLQAARSSVAPPKRLTQLICAPHVPWPLLARVFNTAAVQLGERQLKGAGGGLVKGGRTGGAGGAT